ncbi:ammonia-forming cytochrome c nitrite reductase subunit c552 [Campylobacter devanensis]|uniref:ammonia-forming cytochrome c nitrite reductase subunit c552 n=1 Tax=Campylobacter devanensis TaxID=3161138 RepID=UPI000A33C834|nr:ammonia-forming cytochrome c nitrite reductase subunit c552 [Campylobacter sp. P0023]
MKKALLAILAIIVLIGFVLFNKDISSKKAQPDMAGAISKDVVTMSDDDPRFNVWGKNFPEHMDMYQTVETEAPFETEFGGNHSYSKLIRYPQLTILWAGYPFSIDANEERGHFWIQVDQMDTARNNKDFLNSHGFAAFNGQPAACMNCHSGWTKWLENNAALGDTPREKWVSFNSAKYWTMVKNIPALEGITENSPEHSGPHGGKRMGVACADCHVPNTMELRVTRTALINALTKWRGYEPDPVTGVKATRSEMRSLVCAQCHVEYYFRPTGEKVKTIGESIASDTDKKWWNGTQKTYDEFDSWRDGNKATEIEVAGIELVFPWKQWGKNKPFRIEMFDEYYDENVTRSIFPQDWAHKITKAPMLKIQHPETELYSSSVHAANGVSCADCHMPYVRKGSSKVTNHNVTSPLKDINAACKSCHTQSEEYLKAQIKDIQRSIAFDLRSVEYATVSLINDIKNMRDRLAALPEFQTDGKADDKKISAVLKEVLELHRKGQMRGDFVGAENSTGFHSPREASRMLLQALEMARMGQTKLAEIALQYGFSDFKTSNLGFEDIQKLNPGEIRYKVDLNDARQSTAKGHKAGDRYYEHDNINDGPNANLLELDKNNKPYNHKVLD